MSAADDYPAVAILADAARSMNQRPETVRMFEEITDLRAELSALKATSPDGPTKEQAWAGYRAAQGAVIDAGFTGDVSPRDAIEALSARLAALEARRCDGCAHTAPKWRYYPNDGLRCVRLHADVPVDFSCAAWTEKP